MSRANVDPSSMDDSSKGNVGDFPYIIATMWQEGVLLSCATQRKRQTPSAFAAAAEEGLSMKTAAMKSSSSSSSSEKECCQEAWNVLKDACVYSLPADESTLSTGATYKYSWCLPLFQEAQETDKSHGYNPGLEVFCNNTMAHVPVVPAALRALEARHEDSIAHVVDHEHYALFVSSSNTGTLQYSKQESQRTRGDCYSLWNQYVNGKWIMEEDSSASSVVFPLLANAAPPFAPSSSSSSSFSHSGDDESNVHQDMNVHRDNKNQSLLQAAIHSTLSSSGGMHRLLHSEITLQSCCCCCCPKGRPLDDANYNEVVLTKRRVQSSCSFQASLTVLVYVTQHFFVDMEDALVDGADHYDENNDDIMSASVTLLDSVHDNYDDDDDDKNRNKRMPLIDIEQPSFASRQHVVPIRVQVNGTCPCRGNSSASGRCNHDDHGKDKDDDNDQQSCWQHRIRFATKLHLRYPPLTATGKLQVAFPAPLLDYSSSYMIVCHDSNRSNNQDEDKSSGAPILEQQQQQYQQYFSLATPPRHDARPSIIVLTVATGWQDDVAWVGLATIVVSLIGSMLLLRSLSVVARWD